MAHATSLSAAVADVLAPLPFGDARGVTVLIHALLDPPSTQELDARGWNALLGQARQTGLLARLAALLTEHGLFAAAPFKARTQMRAAAIAAESSQTAVRFEINRVLRALKGMDVPIILMKGAAYVAAALPSARGRFVGDLDLMVPRENIAAVEQVLAAHGWVAADLDEYDQNYYRQWSHEIPPMQHPERDTPIDLHHSIAQLTSRAHPDAAALLAASVRLADPRLRVLGPADLVLHSCVHLFNDQVGMPLRDLFDQHDLMIRFGGEPRFWDDLIERAVLHGLERPVFYMLMQARRMLGTPVPEDVMRAIRPWAPALPARMLMTWLWRMQFTPEPAWQPQRRAALARWMLYVRAHWLRMPPLMLARHLSVKALRNLREGDAERTGNAAG